MIHLFVLHVIFKNCHMIVVLDIYVITPPTYNWYYLNGTAFCWKFKIFERKQSFYITNQH